MARGRRAETACQQRWQSRRGRVQICSLLRGGIAERGGIRVGHRIISIDGESVVAVPHERIVSMLANSVGEVRAARASRLLGGMRSCFVVAGRPRRWRENARRLAVGWPPAPVDGARP